MATITARDVTKRFPLRGQPDVVALDGISLDVADREFVAIVGPSGCGKSTFLYMVGGFIDLTEGSIEVDGQAVRGPGPDRGMVFQHFALFPWLTVRQNIEYGLKEKKVPTEERNRIVDELIQAVKLAGFERAYPKQLSGGMRQRVAIARTLAFDPKILLMDEPFGALDAQTRSMMQEELLRIWDQQRKTVLFVTHDVREAVYLADRVAVMTARPGRIKAIVDARVPGSDRSARTASAEYLETPEFARKVNEIWELVREEVVATQEQEQAAAGARS